MNVITGILLPVEVVAALGGAEALNTMVIGIKQRLGLPPEVGPKTHDQPDNLDKDTYLDLE